MNNECPHPVQSCKTFCEKGFEKKCNIVPICGACNNPTKSCRPGLQVGGFYAKCIQNGIELIRNGNKWVVK